MRFAKLEIKSILALFLAQYDCELVHKNGEKVTELPEPYRNNLCAFFSLFFFFSLLTRSLAMT